VAMVHMEFREAVGVDVDPRQIAECRRRLGDLQGVRFGLTRDLAAGPKEGWDVVTCMEVLEHCVEDERRRVLDVLAVHTRANGRVIISVPIEVGPSIAGKQLFRALAGLRRLGDYQHREKYTPAEMLKSIAGLPVTRVAFDGHGSDGPYGYYGHKGFDYRELAREIETRFRVERRLFSPIAWLGPALNSQVWFVCVPR
jgi:SAM-dependent methyltransferase